MTRRRKTLWWGGTVLAISICIGIALATWAGGAGPSVVATDDGWKCSGKFLFDPSRRPRRVGENVIVLEKFPGTGGRRNFFHREYRLSAIRIPDGKIVYSHVPRAGGRFFQVVSVHLWRDGVVLYGYDWQKSGFEGRSHLIILLDANGEEKARVPAPAKVGKLLAVDGKNGVALFLKRKDDRAFPTRGTLTALGLPSGEVQFREPIENLSRVVVDGKGNAYALLLTEEVVTSDHSAEGARAAMDVAKYSVKPWKKEWTVRVKPELGYCGQIRLWSDRVWLGAMHSSFGGDSDAHWDATRWNIALDPKTGERVKVDVEYDPYRMEVMVEGKKYAVSREGDSLRMTRASPTKHDEDE